MARWAASKGTKRTVFFTAQPEPTDAGSVPLETVATIAVSTRWRAPCGSIRAGDRAVDLVLVDTVPSYPMLAKAHRGAALDVTNKIRAPARV